MGKKKIEKFNKLLQSYKSNKSYVKIYRSFDGREAELYGFILKISKDFLLVQNELEFYLDGYSIIPQEEFDSIRSNVMDKSIYKILKKEGEIKKGFGIKNPPSLKNWNTIFTDLLQLDYHVIVECEGGDSGSFTIGPIIKVNKNSVEIRYYDATGRLEDGLTKVKFKDITIVKFGDRYSTIFRKYLVD